MSNTLEWILVWVYFIWLYRQISISCTIPSGSITNQVKLRLILLLHKFVAFAYNGINRFVFVTTKPIVDILLLGWVGLGFMAYEILLVIICLTLFIRIY